MNNIFFQCTVCFRGARRLPGEPVQIIMEELDEIVYVSDIATYEILYLNEFGKKEFGLTDIGKGRKCYEVLQGLDAPCPFCTNQFLNCETFYTWELTNPISHRHYLLRDKLIRWNGRACPAGIRRRHYGKGKYQPSCAAQA